MTPDERQALREKHVRHHKAENYCLGCGGYVKGDVCDTIRILDATEPPDCEHLPYYGTCYRCGEDLPKVTECDH